MISVQPLRMAGARRPAAALLGALALASGASCDDSAVEGSDIAEGFYGNTLVVSVPAVFYEAEWYIDPDHTYRIVSSMGDESGRWEIDDGQICFERIEPQPGGAPMCYEAAPREAGESWSEVDPSSGNAVEMRLIAGR